MVQAFRRQGREKRRRRQRRYGGGEPMRAPILTLILLTGLLAGPPARAEETPPPACDVPASLLNSDSTLAKVAAAVKSGKLLNVLVVGSRSSTIASQEGSAYPARLLAMLKEKLGPVPVNLSVDRKSVV